MPKEQVQYCSIDGRTCTEVAVHWTPGSFVQLAVQRYPTESVKLESQEIGDVSSLVCRGAGQGPLPTMEAIVLPETVDPATQELAGIQDDGSAVMYSDPLSRKAINDLIRVLRRARDSALGADA